MPLATSAATDDLAHTLAALRGQTDDEVVASALRAQLDCACEAPLSFACGEAEPTVEEFMARIRSLGPWRGPDSTQLIDELYDADGLPR
jgi:hypothetical protein